MVEKIIELLDLHTASYVTIGGELFLECGCRQWCMGGLGMDTFEHRKHVAEELLEYINGDSLHFKLDAILDRLGPKIEISYKFEEPQIGHNKFLTNRDDDAYDTAWEKQKRWWFGNHA